MASGNTVNENKRKSSTELIELNSPHQDRQRKINTFFNQNNNNVLQPQIPSERVNSGSGAPESPRPHQTPFSSSKSDEMSGISRLEASLMDLKTELGQMNKSTNDNINLLANTVMAQNQTILAAINANKLEIESLSTRVQHLETDRGSNPEVTELKLKVDEIAKQLENVIFNNSSKNLNPPATEDMSNLKKDLISIQSQVDARERYERRDEMIVSNLIVDGVNEDKFSAIFTAITVFLKSTVNRNDILYWKLLNRRSQSNYKDILIKFRDFTVKKSIMSSYMATKNLSNKDLNLSEIDQRAYLNDNLTPHNASIFKATKNRFRQANDKAPSLVKAIYIRNGQVYVRKLDDGIILVNSTETLDQLHKSIANKSDLE